MKHKHCYALYIWCGQIIWSQCKGLIRFCDYFLAVGLSFWLVDNLLSYVLSWRMHSWKKERTNRQIALAWRDISRCGTISLLAWFFTLFLAQKEQWPLEQSATARQFCAFSSRLHISAEKTLFLRFLSKTVLNVQCLWSDFVIIRHSNRSSYLQNYITCVQCNWNRTSVYHYCPFS